MTLTYFKLYYHSLQYIIGVIAAVLIWQWKIFRALWTFFGFIKKKVETCEYNPDYPKFVKAEIARLKPIMEKYNGLQPFNGKAIYHTGSTAIVGMFGKPIIDLSICTKNMLPDIPDGLLKDLKDIGYEYWGPAPHNKNKYLDQWFARTENGTQFLIHFLEGEETKIALAKFINFVDYCNANKGAHKRYSDVKKGGLGMNLMDYSFNKFKIYREIMKEANAWKAA